MNHIAEVGKKVIRLSIPERLPTVNILIRMHWAKRKALTERVQQWAHIELLKAGWNFRRQPIKQCAVRINRYSSQEPDPDGLRSTAKLLLDVLQPMSKKHPYGLGVIAEDSSKCIASLEVTHVPKRIARTDVEIEVIE